MSGTQKAAGSAALVLVDGAVPLRPEPALFEAMLEGWRRQQAARRLTGPLVEGRVRLVRRFGEFTGAWPWQWTPGQVEDWITSGGWAHSTVRSYEGALAIFLSYVCDPRREAAMLDVADFAVNPAAPELGGLGICHVRYGKAMRGSPPQWRAVATVMPWAAEALAQYIGQVRPRYEPGGHPAWAEHFTARIREDQQAQGSAPGTRARQAGCGSSRSRRSCSA
jgi:hypothetical protein